MSLRATHCSELKAPPELAAIKMRLSFGGAADVHSAALPVFLSFTNRGVGLKCMIIRQLHFIPNEWYSSAVVQSALMTSQVFSRQRTCRRK
jgi:hypothetical protein